MQKWKQNMQKIKSRWENNFLYINSIMHIYVCKAYFKTQLSFARKLHKRINGNMYDLADMIMHEPLQWKCYKLTPVDTVL